MAAIVRAGRRCQVCNSRQDLEAHHRTYDRVGHEEPGDHRIFHHRLPKLPASLMPRRPRPSRRISLLDGHVWDAVGPADAALALALTTWTNTGTDADKQRARAAYRGLLEAWREALGEARSDAA